VAPADLVEDLDARRAQAIVCAQAGAFTGRRLAIPGQDIRQRVFPCGAPLQLPLGTARALCIISESSASRISRLPS